jgi:hypothetical protein
VLVSTSFRIVVVVVVVVVVVLVVEVVIAIIQGTDNGRSETNYVSSAAAVL